MSYFIAPRVTPPYYHYSNDPSICDAFDNSHVQYISDTLHIIRSVFNPHLIHYTKYAKYALLLLFSIYVYDEKPESRKVYQNVSEYGKVIPKLNIASHLMDREEEK